MDISWKVTRGSEVLEDCSNDQHKEEKTLDEVVKMLRRLWGSTCHIEIHIWQDNWSNS